MISNAYVAAYAAIAIQALRRISQKVLVSQESRPAGIPVSYGHYYLAFSFIVLGSHRPPVYVAIKEYTTRPYKPVQITKQVMKEMNHAGYHVGTSPGGGEYALYSLSLFPYFGPSDNYQFSRSVPGIPYAELDRMVSIARNSL